MIQRILITFSKTNRIETKSPDFKNESKFKKTWHNTILYLLISFLYNSREHQELEDQKDQMVDQENEVQKEHRDHVVLTDQEETQ